MVLPQYPKRRDGDVVVELAFVWLECDEEDTVEQDDDTGHRVVEAGCGL